MVGGYQEVEVEFVADNPGRTLFHCHQQLHLDFGFMALFDYASGGARGRELSPGRGRGPRKGDPNITFVYQNHYSP
jgi:hypothetical protein